MRVFFVGKQMLGVVYLPVISQANERKEQTLNKGCAFMLLWREAAMGSARLRSGQAGRGQPELSHGTGWQESSC